MPDDLDALELRPEMVVVDAVPVPEVPIEDVMFPALPPAVCESQSSASRAFVQACTTGRARASAILILQQQGHSSREIGKMLGLSDVAVRQALSRARRAGRLNDLRQILENDSTALAVESLNHHLRAKDKQATFKHLEGMGHWKKFNNNTNEGSPTFVMPKLEVTVINAPNMGGQQIVSMPVGVPREDSSDE